MLPLLPILMVIYSCFLIATSMPKPPRLIPTHFHAANMAALRQSAVTAICNPWSKDGKTLELSLVQQEAGGQHRTLLTSRERWTLSADGEFLKLQRSVSAPEGSDGVILVFRKGPTASPAPQP